MKVRHLILVLHLFLSLALLQAQQIESKSASIILNAKKTKDVPKTEILIVSPSVPEGTRFVTDNPRVVLVGKIINAKGEVSLFVNASKTIVEKDGTFQALLFLPKTGINEVSLQVFDEKNNRIEKKMEMEWETEEAILAKKIRNEAKYYGLIIAIGDYQDKTIPSLESTIPDAQKFRNLLTLKYSFADRNIVFIENAKSGDIISALEQLRQIVTQNDNLLVYYAGHGIWYAESNVGYWLPSDARNTNRDKWLSNSQIVDRLKEIQSKHLLLISDACFSGAIFTSRAINTNRKETIKELYELQSRKAMTSGSRTEVPDSSPFTKNLIELLNDNQEELLTSEELFNKIETAVEGNSKVIPVYGKIENANDKGGEFVFIKNHLPEK